MLDEEADGVSTAAATKAFVEFLGLRDGKRGGLLVVERAKSQVTVTPSFQFDEFTDDIDDVDAVEDLLYGMWCDQGCEDTKEPLAFDGSFEEQLIHKNPSLITLTAMPGRQGFDRIGLHFYMPVATGGDVHIQDPVHRGTSLDRHFR